MHANRLACTLACTLPRQRVEWLGSCLAGTTAVGDLVDAHNKDNKWHEWLRTIRSSKERPKWSGRARQFVEVQGLVRTGVRRPESLASANTPRTKSVDAPMRSQTPTNSYIPTFPSP